MTSTAHPIRNHIGALNTTFLAIAIVALLLYVVMANVLASQAWKIADARDRLTTILDERNTLVAQQSEFEDRARLTELATSVGMVPAGAVVYLMQDRAVAAR